MIIGIGIDIVDKDRIKKSMDRHGEKFIQRILTTVERDQMPTADSRKIEYLAGRFAVKEAFSKAVGYGIGHKLSWQDITVENNRNGKPSIELCPQWLKKNYPDQNIQFHVSITHEKKYAVAQVIIEG